MTVSNSVCDPCRDLDERIAAFEGAWRSGATQITPHLPHRDDDHYFDVLCEAIRCDLELHWTHRQPRTLADYQSEFPEVFDQPERLKHLAFEEYRQRVMAGESPAPKEFGDRWEIDVTDWPAAEHLTEATAILPPMFERGRGATNAPEAPLALTRPRFPTPGEKLLHFELISELGRGAFARVYLARQSDLSDRIVALKVAPDLQGEPQKLAQLQHTNIMPIYSGHRAQGLQIVCMPYFGGTTLDRVLADWANTDMSMPESGRRFLSTLFDRHADSTVTSDPRPKSAPHPSESSPPLENRSTTALQLLSQLSHVEAVLWIVARLADGLAHAHERGILHRDLKPANIFITEDGQPMILDFNLAADARLPGGWAGARVGGTLPYLAPEGLQLVLDRTGPGIGPASDLFSLGVLMYEMLTGRRPFQGSRAGTLQAIAQLLEQRRQAPLPPRQLNLAVSPAVNNVVMKLLQPDPAHRYASAAELREDLERQLENRPLRHAPDVSIPERMTKWRRRHPRLIAGLAVALAAFVILILPTTVLAVRHHQLAERRREIERSEAILAQQDTVRKARHAQVLLASHSGSGEFLEAGRSLARETLAAYRIEDNFDWQEQPALRHLTEEQRRELQCELGETLMLLARSERFRNVESPNGAAEAAAKWSRLAEACYPADAQPQWLHRQRRELTGAALTSEPSSVSVLDQYHRGVFAADEGRFREALSCLIPFSERHPRHFSSWYLRGIAHASLGAWSDAAASFTVCISLEPEFAWSYFSRGRVRLEQKRYEAAEADFSEAIQRRAKWTAALFNRALAREGRQNWKAAEEDISEALCQLDAPTRAYFVRARIRRRLGDESGARRDELEALRRTPSDALSWNSRGYWRLESEPQQALLDFEEALKLEPRLREALQNKAIVLADYLERPRDAVAAMNQLLKYFPDDVEAQGGRGVYLARIGERHRALTDAADVLRSEPTAFRYFQTAGLYAQLFAHSKKDADKIESLRLLAAAFRGGFADVALLESDPDLDPIRSDREFQQMLTAARSLTRR